MNPETLFLVSVLTTNWLPFTVKVPNGDGTTHERRMEASIIVLDRYAMFNAGGLTNRVFIGSEVFSNLPPTIREAERITHATYITNWPVKIWNLTNIIAVTNDAIVPSHL